MYFIGMINEYVFKRFGIGSMLLTKNPDNLSIHLCSEGGTRECDAKYCLFFDEEGLILWEVGGRVGVRRRRGHVLGITVSRERPGGGYLRVSGKTQLVINDKKLKGQRYNQEGQNPICYPQYEKSL